MDSGLGEFLGELEERPGVVDRRFYAIALKARADELQGLLTRAGFAVFPLKDRALRLLVESTLRGCAPPAPSPESPTVIGLSRGQLDMGERLGRSYQLTRWPRTLPLGYMQRVLALGLPMDLSIHISPIATPQAVRTLEWQRVKMESGIAISLRRGRTASPETEIALEDASRLRDEVHRGRERLFNASFSITIYAGTADSLKERGQQLKGLFAGSMAVLDAMRFRQHDGHLSTLPLALNPGGSWRTVDTSTLAFLLPFAPPDLDTRKGTLFGLDLRSGSVVTYDPFDGAFLNANTVVMARSGAGKSFSTKLGLLRGISRGIVYYVIDPEGEYASLAQTAGGRVLTPGVAGHGLNPFVLEEEDESEVLQRVGGLRRLIEVMVGERFSPEQRATLDEALTAYYTTHRAVTGFQDFFIFLEAQGYKGMASLLRPFEHRQSAAPAHRPGGRPAGNRASHHRLQPSPAGAGAKARRNAGVRRGGLVHGLQGPQAQGAGGGRGVEHHAAPRGGLFPGLPGKASKEAPSGPHLHYPGCPGLPQRGHQPLQETPHSSCCSSRTRRPCGRSGSPSTSCWRPTSSGFSPVLAGMGC